VRAGVCTILQSRSDIDICGQASNGREAIERAIQLKPDLVVLDITMPVLDGFSAAREISTLLPHVAILLLSMHDSPTMTNVAKSSGARGFVSKSQAASVLLKAVDAVARNQTFFPH
jgi:DNA-binding NarL/FixJ family response regulator